MTHKFKGRPWLSQMACSLVFMSTLVRSIRRPRPRASGKQSPGLFTDPPNSRPCWSLSGCFEVGRINRHGLLFAVVSGQTGHHPAEDAFVAPSPPAIVQGFVRAPYSSSASRHRKPFRLIKIIPLKSHRSSTRGLPWDLGKSAQGGPSGRRSTRKDSTCSPLVFEP